MEVLLDDVMGKPVWMWAIFVGVVGAILVLDLGVLHRRPRAISVKESFLLSALYVAIALLFGGWLWAILGAQSGREFLTGFVVEKSLAADNLFIISLVFAHFTIPPLYQHRVLFWGILGVIVLRVIMIGLGAALVAQFSWVLYVFAAFLIFTGIRMLWTSKEMPDVGHNPMLRFLRKHFRITDVLHGQKFIVRLPDPTSGKVVVYGTPLLAALVTIEFVDLIFAVDSVPAIFAITLDPYIVYTSNIFAILGLRALYFALAVVIHRFKYLKQGLAGVLIFIGGKTFVADLMGWEKFPASISLAVTMVLIGGAIAASLYKTSRDAGSRKAPETLPRGPEAHV